MQKKRHEYVPGCPEVLENLETSKMTISSEEMAVKEGLDSLFPSLLAEKMPYIEFKKDTQGSKMTCEKPLKVSFLK